MGYGYARVSTAGQERNDKGLEAQTAQHSAAAAEALMDETGSNHTVSTYP